MRIAWLALPFLLTACAERWERPGTSEAQADAMNAQCLANAAAAVPPNVVDRIASPARRETVRDCRRDGDRERCTTTERFVPERWERVDLNNGARDGFRQNCMVEKGFTFRGYRPLRLD